MHLALGALAAGAPRPLAAPPIHSRGPQGQRAALEEVEEEDEEPEQQSMPFEVFVPQVGG